MRNKTYGFLAGIFAMLIGMSLTACYPGGPEYISDLDIVVSNRAPDFDFGATKTYFLSDSVVTITNGSNDSRDTIDNKLILDQIVQNMKDRNFVREFNTDSIQSYDLVLLVTKVANNQSGIGWIPGPGYGPCYPGWCYPGYGWGYPGYGGYPVVYDMSTGSLLIEMADTKSIDSEEETIDVVWLAGLNGLLQGSLGNRTSRVKGAIDAAFNQSPYLRSN